MLGGMTIIAVFNQKGGVGKTTTVLNLLAAIARRGQRPWGIDLDPQAHLSHVFGARPRRADDSVYAFFARGAPLADVAQITRSGVVLCPAHLDLAKLDATLGKGMDEVTRLRQALQQPGTTTGPVVIDCNPLLTVLSLNAVFACDVLVIPVSSDYLALRGALELERALKAMEPVFRRRLPRRYLLTRYDARKTMSAEVVEGMAKALRADEICTTRIRENVHLAESPAFELDIFRHAPDGRGAADYNALLDELSGAGFVA